jgi:hypothetical protein
MLLGLAACSCSCSCAAFAFAGLCWYFHLGTQFNNARMPLPTLTSLFSVLLACFYGLPVLVPPVYRHPGRRRAGRHLPDYYRKPRLSPIALACGRPYAWQERSLCLPHRVAAIRGAAQSSTKAVTAAASARRDRDTAWCFCPCATAPTAVRSPAVRSARCTLQSLLGRRSNGC